MDQKDKLIKLQFSIDEINLILTGLAELPLKVSKTLFDQITIEGNHQLNELMKSDNAKKNSNKSWFFGLEPLMLLFLTDDYLFRFNYDIDKLEKIRDYFVTNCDQNTLWGLDYMQYHLLFYGGDNLDSYQVAKKLIEDYYKSIKKKSPIIKEWSQVFDKFLNLDNNIVMSLDSYYGEWKEDTGDYRADVSDLSEVLSSIKKYPKLHQSLIKILDSRD